MEVTEKSAEGLDRRFTVKVSAAELDEKLIKRLEGMKGQIHLKGFRKGKAPIPYLKKMYGKGVMSEIVQEVVSETATKAFTDRDMQPAMAPSPQFHGDMEKVMTGEADLEYDVHAEILPEIEPMDVSTLSLTRPVAEVPQEDIDEALKNLADQNKQYDAKGEGEAAADGDMVTIDFVGRIDGEEFDGGRGDGHDLVLGSDTFIPGFEDQLIGVKADEDRDVTVNFPEEYGADNLAGKEAVFSVHVSEVKAAQAVEINDALAERMGLESIDQLKERITERLSESFTQQSRMHVKRALLDKLDTSHDFELPQSMVNAEFEQIWRQVEGAERDEDDKDKSEDELKADYRKIAERRVRLGLVLAEIGKRAEVQVPAEEFQQAVQSQAMREAQMMQMQGQDVTPQQVLEFYRSNPDALAQIRAPLFEEQVVDHVLEQATVTDKTVSKDELMADPEGDDAVA